MTTVFHVAVNGSDSGDGSPEAPLRTINRAAALAFPGDTVRVHGGQYREWVKPVRGGLSDQRRITYEAAGGEHVVIKGSEAITGWERDGETVWRASIPNSVFGEYNPFAEEVDGDWLEHPASDGLRHLGEVYLNGRSFYEVTSRGAVSEPVERTHSVDLWTGVNEPIQHPDQTTYVWYAVIEADTTVVWANFHAFDPNVELVEVNVRRSIFYPAAHHLNYITVRGFEMAHAATPWAPPTADQPGLIGPNWSKGWIIEDNVIHDAKCAAISLGKEEATGHNYATIRGDKPGYQYQLESVFSARQIGWDREHIGSHIVRRNRVFDCGQNAIVGHLGCAFSTVTDNHIYNIGIKREYYGYEIAGIKMHAAIDVTIEHNRIHHCTLGTWLDWQTQGTRVARNLYYANGRDLFVEVSHGPYLVDHNVLGSRVSVEVTCQGGAYVNNLIAGAVRLETVQDRATPYHVPHSTEIAGYAFVDGGDDRFINNLFMGGDLDQAFAPTSTRHNMAAYGTAGYDQYPASFTEYRARLAEGTGDHQRFLAMKQPVCVRSNAYANGAKGYRAEHDAVLIADQVEVDVDDTGDHVYLVLVAPDQLAAVRTNVVTAHDLGRVRYPDADFEEPDGSPVVVDTDLTGTCKKVLGGHPVGPLADLQAGHSRTCIW